MCKLSFIPLNYDYDEITSHMDIDVDTQLKISFLERTSDLRLGQL